MTTIGNGIVTGIESENETAEIDIGTGAASVSGDAMTIIGMIGTDRIDFGLRKIAIVIAPIGIETIGIEITVAAASEIVAEVEVAIATAGEKVVHDHATVIGVGHVPAREALIPRIVSVAEEICRSK